MKLLHLMIELFDFNCIKRTLCSEDDRRILWDVQQAVVVEPVKILCVLIVPISLDFVVPYALRCKDKRSVALHHRLYSIWQCVLAFGVGSQHESYYMGKPRIHLCQRSIHVIIARTGFDNSSLVTYPNIFLCFWINVDEKELTTCLSWELL